MMPKILLIIYYWFSACASVTVVKEDDVKACEAEAKTLVIAHMQLFPHDRKPTWACVIAPPEVH